MADVQYANPFGLYQDQNPIPTNPFMSGMQAQQNMNTAQPFINQAQESSNLELMKKRMMTGEEMSPQAQGARMSAYPLQQSQNESKQRMVLPEEQAQQQRLAEEIRGLPGVTDQKIAQAKLARQAAEGTPMRHLHDELGTLYDTIKDAPETARPFLYASSLARWRQTHPGSDVPEEFRNYDPRILPDLAAIRHSQIETGEQRGKEALEAMRNDTTLKAGGIHNQGSADVARINADAHVAGIRIMDATKQQETPPKAIARLRKSLAADPNDQEAKDEYKYYIDDAWDKRQEKDMSLMMLKMQALGNDPKASVEAKAKYDQAQYEFYSEKGIPIVKNGYEWVKGDPRKPTSWKKAK